MSITFAIAIYFVIWWTMLFVALPFAGHSQHDSGARVPGTPASAPHAPKLLRVVLITTVLSGIILAAVYLTMEYQLLDRLGIPIRPPADAPVG